MIDVLVDAGFPVKVCCRKLGVSSPGYYRYRQRRHSGLDYVSPIEFELTSNHTTKTA